MRGRSHKRQLKGPPLAELRAANKAPITYAEGCIELVIAVLGGNRIGKRTGCRNNGIGQQWFEMAGWILKADAQAIKRVYYGS